MILTFMKHFNRYRHLGTTSNFININFKGLSQNNLKLLNYNNIIYLKAFIF